MIDAYQHGDKAASPLCTSQTECNFLAYEKIPIPLGIFPGGSGNDFVMTLEGGKYAAKIKQRNFTTDIFVDCICRRNLRTIDVITANGTAFLNIGNIGIDARIVKNAAALKQKYGGQAYLAAVYKSIMKHKNIPVKVEFNNETVEKEFTLIAVCNGQYYGGGLRISPSAKFDDGKITLCMIDRVSRPKLGILFPSLLFEKHVHLNVVNYFDCTELRITLPPGIETLCLDGNLFPIEGEIHFKVLPKVLDLFV